MAPFRETSRGHAQFLLTALAVITFTALVSGNTYNVGDYVPVARQAQFHNMRTHWHDLIGRHCPRFGIDREVVLPIPRPIGFSFPEDTYKMKLSFGSERFVTGWLVMMSKDTKMPPVLHITLSHFAGEFRGIKTRLILMNPKKLTEHQRLVMEWNNETLWPKHAILVYKWKEHAEVDVTAGLLLLFATSFSLTTLLAIYILQSSKEKLARFMSEQLADSTGSGAPGGMGGMGAVGGMVGMGAMGGGASVPKVD